MEDIIKLTNENGEEEEFYLIASFGLDDENYVALMGVDDKEELILMLRIAGEEDGEFYFEAIESEAELNDVIDAFEELEIQE